MEILLPLTVLVMGFHIAVKDYTETVNSSRRSHQEHIERHEVVFETFRVKITEIIIAK
jgi:hypothetical protein